MGLSKILSPYNYQLLQFWRSFDNNSVKKSLSRRIFILLAADYGNIGDIAITIAQENYLKRLFKELDVVLMPSTSSFSDLKSLVNNVGKNDILSFVGGGNCGDLYYPYEIYRQLVVELLYKNRIIIFPQSIKFERKENFIRAQKHYKAAGKHLMFCAREIDSFKLAKELFYTNYIELLPDVVFTMSYFTGLANRNGFMTCLRSDKERYLSEADHAMIFSILAKYTSDIEVTDTYSNINMAINLIYEYFDRFVDNMKHKQLLVTDRLHGMILGYITGTPTIVLPNSNSKIRTSYEFIKECNYICFIDDLLQFDSMVNKMVKIIPNYDYFSKKHDDICQRYNSVLNSIIE